MQLCSLNIAHTSEPPYRTGPFAFGIFDRPEEHENGETLKVEFEMRRNAGDHGLIDDETGALSSAQVRPCDSAMDPTRFALARPVLSPATELSLNETSHSIGMSNETSYA
jgi:hypothetical protein